MITRIIGEVAILCSKLLPQHPLRNFPEVVVQQHTYFTLHVSLNFPVMLVLLIIILHKHCYKNKIFIGFLNISYIQFIDIKGTAWGHGQVIEMCSHAIFYISCAEREPSITLDYL